SILREYLVDLEGFEIVDECANGFDAVKSVNEKRPDLLLLDIQMPKLDGFEVLELLDWKPKIVFVTAYDEYALKAFEVHAVDYLLKPFSRERLREVLTHASSFVEREWPDRITGLTQSAREHAKPLQRVLVRDGAEIEVIPVQKIDYIEAQDDYVAIAAMGKKRRKQQTIGDLERLLDPQRFVRIHRSYIVNIDRLSKVDLYAKDSHVAILTDGTKLPISRSGYARLRELL
ncbi:MAG TPA: LytTR family DNA-binding domain-containing protein, partial [Thermoanaerobaculia bacterium]